MPRESKLDRIKSWLDRLNRFSQSDRTVAEFCGAECVSVPSFYQWKRRLSPLVVESKPPRKRLPSKPKKRRAMKPRSAFTQLTVVDRQATTASISLPGCITIELGTHQDAIVTILEQVLRHSSQKLMLEQKAASC
jgi:hypothetical protein